MVVQAGSPYFAPNAYWCIEASVRGAGLRTVPYHVEVPTFGTWGFVLAAAAGPPRLRLADDVPELRFVDGASLRAAAVFPKDRRRRDVPDSTLVHPRVLDYTRSEWRGY